MTLNEPVFPKTPQNAHNTPPGSSEDKLKTSLAYRSEKEDHLVPTSEEVGTAEHRPRRGMIYDAPLGLKF